MVKRFVSLSVLCLLSCKHTDIPPDQQAAEKSDISAHALPFFPEDLEDLPFLMEKLNLSEINGVLEKKGKIFFGNGEPTLKYSRNIRTGKITTDNADLENLANDHSFYWSRRGDELLKITGEKDTIKYTVANQKVVKVTKGYNVYYNYGADGNVQSSIESSHSFKQTRRYVWSAGKLQRIETAQEKVPYVSVKYFDARQFPYLEVNYKNASLKDTLFTLRYSYR